MHSWGQENPNKLFDWVKKGKEKNIKNIKMPLYKLKAQPHLGFWTSHHKKRYRRKRRDREGQGKIIMDLKRVYKKKI